MTQKPESGLKFWPSKNNDMSELAEQLDTANGATRILIVTDGVSSIEGYLANLPAVCDLADEHGKFVMVKGSHPITPIMLDDAALASRFADAILDNGVCVIGFSFPGVPQGKARIRSQISPAHTREDLEFAIAKFGEVKSEMKI